ARGSGLRDAASGGVRLDQPRAHAAAQCEGPGAVAEGRAAPRLHAVLRAHLPVRAHAVSGRRAAAAGGSRAGESDALAACGALPRTTAQICSLPAHRIGPVGAPVGEPPGGSSVTASAAVLSSTLPFFTI